MARAKQTAKRRAPARPAPKRRSTKRAPQRAAAKRAAAKRPAAKRPAAGAKTARTRADAARDPMAMTAPNGRPAGNGIGLRMQHFEFTTHDLEGIRRFYTETLGFTNEQSFPALGHTSVFVTPTSSLGFLAPAPNSAPESWSPPGEPTLYFHVADVDRVHADLSAKGVSFEQPPRDMPWGQRMAVIRDPEGRRVCFLHRLQR